MMEQSTQTNNIIERPKEQKGRPKGTAIFTEEENKERARQRARLHYSLNFEKERERKRSEYHAKNNVQTGITCLTLFLLISIKQLANLSYIRRLTNPYPLDLAKSD